MSDCYKCGRVLRYRQLCPCSDTCPRCGRERGEREGCRALVSDAGQIDCYQHAIARAERERDEARAEASLAATDAQSAVTALASVVEALGYTDHGLRVGQVRMGAMTHLAECVRKARDNAKAEVADLSERLRIAERERDAARAERDEAVGEMRAAVAMAEEFAQIDHDADGPSTDILAIVHSMRTRLRNGAVDVSELREKLRRHEERHRIVSHELDEARAEANATADAYDDQSHRLADARREIDQLRYALRLATTTRDAAQAIATRETERRREVEGWLDHASDSLDACHDEAIDAIRGEMAARAEADALRELAWSWCISAVNMRDAPRSVLDSRPKMPTPEEQPIESLGPVPVTREHVSEFDEGIGSEYRASRSLAWLIREAVRRGAKLEGDDQ